MRGTGRVALWLGVGSLLVGIFSRLTYQPIYGLYARSFLGFAQACFLFSIATSVLARES